MAAVPVVDPEVAAVLVLIPAELFVRSQQKNGAGCRG
jgi:hypothetical protein